MITRNIVGPIPEPDELYGRDEFIGHVWRQISANNILLLAPRRFGKSGVMRHVHQRPRSGYLPIYFDLEDVDSPAEFVWRITRELLSRDVLRSLLGKARGFPAAIGKWFKETFDEVGFDGAKVKFKEAIERDWRDAGRRMLLELEKADDTLVFIFDELPAMLDKMRDKCDDETARDFLAWFRTVRLAQKDVLRRHRFIVGGSIGIDTILRQLEVPDKLNDFQRLYVEPLPRETALQLATDLAAALEIQWNESLCDVMLGLIGPPVPYFIHLVFAQLAQLPPERRRDLTETDLTGAYCDRVLGPTCQSYFDHYKTRLKRFGKQGEKAAIAVLRCVAGAPVGRVSRLVLRDVYGKARGRGANDTEFDELLADMEHDWYLVLDSTTNEYHFMLNVMGDWWRRWYPASAKGRGAKGVE